MKRNVARLALVAASVVLTLALLEGGLREAGSLYLRYRLASRPLPGRDDLNVLCVGDSYTFGMGASKGRSYPEQLEALLGRRWRVDNLGQPGMNSAQLLGSLERQLLAYRPEAVVLLIGKNDSTQLLSAPSWRLGKLVLAATARPPGIEQACDAPYGQTYGALRERGDLAGAERVARACVKARPGCAVAHYNLADVLNQRSQTEEALREVQESLRLGLHPRRLSAAFQLRLILRRKAGLEAAPTQAQTDGTLAGNVKEAIDTLSRYGIRAIVVNYPNTPQLCLQRVCRPPGCSFVDVYSLFQSRLKTEPALRYFSGDFRPPQDGHPNDRGYALIAEEVAKRLNSP